MNSLAPYAIVVSDFNNDNYLDIAAAFAKSNNVGVLLGYGNGSFGVMMTYSTGTGSKPFALAVSDFNNDSQWDIVVANSITNNIGVLLGYGNGSFTTMMPFSTGDSSNPYPVAIGDFNNDNQLDSVSDNFNVQTVGILLGNGNGTFATVTTYSTGDGSTPTYVDVGDFNNDSYLDIAVVNYGINNVVVLFEFGDGRSGPLALAIGDFDNNARLDIAVANSQLNNIGVFLGFGSKPYADVMTYTTGSGSQPHSVAVGDFNKDDRLDIAVGNYGTDNVGILFGSGHEAFDTMMIYSTGVGSAPYSVVIDNFNNDSQLDIVVTNSGTDDIVVFLGFGDGTFAIEVVYSTGERSRPYTVTITDFNDDNILDIAIANSGTNNIFLLYGYGNGTFGNETSYGLGYGYRPYSIAVKDLNHDGWIDIVIACYGTNNIEILMKMC